MVSRFDFWFATAVVEQPLLKLLDGGLVTVKTSAASEVQVRLAHNLSALYRKDINRAALARPKVDASTLVYSRESQTFVRKADFLAFPRVRQFTGLAKHVIREGGGVMADEHAKDIWILTFTLPGDTQEAIDTYAFHDKEIKNALLQNFRKAFEKCRTSPRETLDYVCVSELQDRGAIHLHIAVPFTNTRFKRHVKVCYRRWWRKLIHLYSRKSGVDLAARPDGESWHGQSNMWSLQCEQVEKSVAEYLSKYLSKDASKCPTNDAHCPSRWWSISKPLREKVKAARMSETSMMVDYETAALAVENTCRVLAESGLEFRPVTSRFDGQHLGYVFFPPREIKGWIYEWAKILATTRGGMTAVEKEDDYKCTQATNVNEF